MTDLLEEEYGNWRMPLWHAMLHATPARVVIDQAHHTYRVEDGSFRSIYADDIRDQEINTLIREWAELMRAEDRPRFVQTFSLARLREAFENHRQSLCLVTGLTDSPRDLVLTSVRFGQRIPSMIAEFTFQTTHLE